MGKYLLQLLIVIGTFFLISTTVFAQESIKIEEVQITSSGSDQRVLVNVNFPSNSSDKNVLDVKNEYLASGFQKASSGGNDIGCQVSGTKIICDNSSGFISFEFIWNSKKYLENIFCKNVTAKKQNSQSLSTNRYTEESDSAYPYVRKIVTTRVTTDGNLSETYADIANNASFAVLWNVNNIVRSENRINEISFIDALSYVKMGDIEFHDGATYRPRSGSFQKFTPLSGNMGSYELFFANLSSKKIDVEGVDMVLCKSKNIELETDIITLHSSQANTNGNEITTTETRNFAFDWQKVSYDAPITPTNTPTHTPTLTVKPTHTPTPTQSSTSSTVSNPTNTPTPASQNSNTNSSSTNSQNLPTPTIVSTTNSFTIKSGEVLGSSTASERQNLMKDKSSPVSENVGKLQGKGSLTISDSEKNTLPPIYILITILVVALLGFWSYIGRQKIVKFVTKLLALLLFSTFLIGSSKVVSAQSAYTSYKIVDAFIMQGYGGYTSVTNLANIYVTVSSGVSGRFVISRNPDGTGAVNVGNYLNVQVQHTYYSSTQSYWVGPQDTLYTHYNCPDVTTVEPQNVSNWFHSEGSYNILFRFITSCYKSFPVSDLYLVFVPNPTATPTSTPTNTPTPTPTPFPKFLDLPWDYKSKGLTFSSAATKINSFFDHEYPLLSIGVYGVADDESMLVNYEGNKDRIQYSSHDGYDYGAPAKIYLNTPLLATGDGVATYMDINKCGPCGNAVYIDHGNGFQTRYYHMIFDSLYAERNGKEINVKSGDQIGTVGSTGKSSGPHIHFMVIYDKNHDGNFEDNIPDGIIDPYGWEGDVGSDPWENATFQSPYGVNRTGMKSSYLWKYDIFDKKEVLNNKKTEFVGDGFVANINDMKLTDEESLEFRAKIVPAVAKILAEKKEKASVAFDITVKDPATGQFVRYFNNPFNLIIDLTSDVEEYFKPETLKIHSSDDEGTTWKEEVTVIDWQNKKAIAAINHTTLFAVYGEKKSDEPPNTVIIAKGIGKEAKYRSDVNIKIDVSNKDASEMRYTLYTLDSEYGWREYLGEFSVASEGAHMIRAFSEDKYGNIEDPKTLSFEIDKTPPEIKVSYATDSADFVFANAENDVALRQAPPYAISYGVAKQDDTNNVVVVEDEAGNTNELTYETYMQDDMHILRILGNKRNGVEIDFQPTIYAIGNDIEYFRSGENGARILRNSSDQRIRVEDDSVTNLYEKSSTLQLVTDGDRLKEDIGNR